VASLGERRARLCRRLAKFLQDAVAQSLGIAFARFRKTNDLVCDYFVGRVAAIARTEAPVEEFCKRAIPHRLELGHVDVILADERLNLAKAAQSEELRAAFEKHEAETEEQIGRLEQVFAAIDQKPQGKTCDAIVGITEEGAEIMKEYKGSPALDAGLLAAAQAVEHYEISRYGTLIAWAEELGLEDAVSLLEETLEEEKATDEALTEIAKSAINQQAEAA
jgi:ferritin-like metal-binding protein YciE